MSVSIIGTQCNKKFIKFLLDYICQPPTWYIFFRTQPPKNRQTISALFPCQNKNKISICTKQKVPPLNYTLFSIPSKFLSFYARSSISHTAVAGILDQLGVLPKSTPLGLGLGGSPLALSPLELLSRDLEVEHTLLGVNDNLVTVLDKGNGATLHGLGHDVTDQKAVRTTGEAPISDEGNILAKASAHDGRARLKHLRHTRTTLGTLVADDNDGLLALLDLTALESLNEAILVVVDLGGTLETETLLASDLADAAAGGEGATENLDVTGRLDGVAHGADDLLLGGEVGVGLDVLLHGLAGDGDARAINDTFPEKELEEGGGTTNLAEILHDVLAGGLEVSEEGDSVGNGLEVVDSELDANGVGDGDEMEDGVGAATKNGNDGHGVLKGLAGHDVAGADVLSEEGLNSLTDALALGLLAGVLGGVAGRAGESHTESLDGAGHGVGSVHATARTTTGASVADDVEALLLVDLAGKVLAVGLESADNVDGLATSTAAGLDGTTIHHDTRAVDSAHSDQHTGHVLVATGQGNVGVVPLAIHDGLDTVGNNFSALQAVTHTSGTHADTVGDTNSVEAHGHEASLLDAVSDETGEVEQVHVARVAIVPDGRNTDLRLVHVGLRQTSSVKHGLRSTLGLGLGDGGRDPVELLIGIAAGSGRKKAAREG